MCILWAASTESARNATQIGIPSEQTSRRKSLKPRRRAHHPNLDMLPQPPQRIAFRPLPERRVRLRHRKGRLPKLAELWPTKCRRSRQRIRNAQGGFGSTKDRNRAERPLRDRYIQEMSIGSEGSFLRLGRFRFGIGGFCCGLERCFCILCSFRFRGRLRFARLPPGLSEYVSHSDSRTGSFFRTCGTEPCGASLVDDSCSAAILACQLTCSLRDRFTTLTRSR